MKQLTYNERVQAIAEEMFRDDEGLKQDSRISKLDWIISGDLYMRRARIAVAEMAEQFNNGWSCGVLHANNNDGYKRGDCLKRLGLIPDDGHVPESNFEKAIREAAERNCGQEAGGDEG